MNYVDFGWSTSTQCECYSSFDTKLCDNVFPDEHTLNNSCKSHSHGRIAPIRSLNGTFAIRTEKTYAHLEHIQYCRGVCFGFIMMRFRFITLSIEMRCSVCVVLCVFISLLSKTPHSFHMLNRKHGMFGTRTRTITRQHAERSDVTERTHRTNTTVLYAMSRRSRSHCKHPNRLDTDNKLNTKHWRKMPDGASIDDCVCVLIWLVMRTDAPDWQPAAVGRKGKHDVCVYFERIVDSLLWRLLWRVIEELRRWLISWLQNGTFARSNWPSY